MAVGMHPQFKNVKRTLILCLVSAMLLGSDVRAQNMEPVGQRTALKEATKNLFAIGVGIHDRIPDRVADHSLLLAQFDMGRLRRRRCVQQESPRLLRLHWHDREYGRRPSVSKALEAQGIKHAYYESEGTAHEWQTWRRSFHGFAPLLFQN